MASNELAEQIEAAFDYRGDCTVTLKSGEQVVGYLFNRELAPHPKVAGEPFVELYLADGSRVRHPVARVEAIALTGKDHAEA